MEMLHSADAIFIDRRRNRIADMNPARTLIVGLGVSGLAAVRHLVAHGERVRVVDSRAEPPGLGELAATAPAVSVHTGSLDVRLLDDASRLVVSPGVALDTPLINAARERGIEIIGELELFARAAPAPVIAVTGSNGKSTVVTLATEILAARGVAALAGGNLGPPALDLLREPTPDAYVLEVSSFQLETTQSLRPVVAAVLNVTPDHIDRHGSLEAYAAIKSQLLKSADRAIWNADDRLVRLMARGHDDAVAFSVEQTLDEGWSIVVRDGGRWLARDAEPLFEAAALAPALSGRSGEANALAALALTEPFGGDTGAAIDVLRNFRGLPHRLELVATRNGARYVNDSKATNVGATCAAIASTAGAIVLIAGGLGKDADFGPLAEAARGRLRAALLIGRAAPEIAAVLDSVAEVETVATLGDAVRRAHALAQPGDTVLLSPACASQDMFSDYRQRGEAFAQAVRDLAE